MPINIDQQIANEAIPNKMPGIAGSHPLPILSEMIAPRIINKNGNKNKNTYIIKSSQII